MNMGNEFEKERLTLINASPALGFVWMQLKLRENKAIPTIGVAQDLSCEFNPDFIKSLSYEERVGVMAHEACHVVLEHIWSDITYKGVFYKHQMEYDPYLTNIAMDGVINAILANHGFTLPKEGVEGKSEYLGMSAEELLNKLLEQAKNNKSNKNKNGNNDSNNNNNKNRNQAGFDSHEKFGSGAKKDDKDGNEENNKRLTQEELEKLKMRIKNILASASSDGVAEDLKIIIKPFNKVDWKTILRNTISSVKANESKKYPNKHLLPIQSQMHHKVIYGKVVKNNVPKIGFFVDVSGSVDKEQIGEFLGVVNSIRTVTKAFEVITFDHEIEGIYKPEDLTPENLIIKGGGGTNFKPLLGYLENNKYDYIVLLTDGYFADSVCQIPKSIAFIPSKNEEFEKNFKKVIIMQE
jgi:predicted metal-dependent peptidase